MHFENLLSNEGNENVKNNPGRLQPRAKSPHYFSRFNLSAFDTLFVQILINYSYKSDLDNTRRPSESMQLGTRATQGKKNV